MAAENMESLNMNDYQERARATAQYPGMIETKAAPMEIVGPGLIYCALKLNGEAGEFAEKVGKIMRDKDSQISADDRVALGNELGDVLWYISQAALELDFPLGQIARMNLNKLNSRRERNMIGGSGDDR